MAGFSRRTVIRGSPATALGRGVPSNPTRSTSTPFAASARAWYSIRALRPRSPSDTTTALIGEEVRAKGVGDLYHGRCAAQVVSLVRGALQCRLRRTAGASAPGDLWRRADDTQRWIGGRRLGRFPRRASS